MLRASLKPSVLALSYAFCSFSAWALSDQDIPISVEARSVEGVDQKNLKARGEVHAVKGERIVDSDWADYQEQGQHLQAGDQVKGSRGLDTFQSRFVDMWMETDTGFADKPSFILRPSQQTGRRVRGEGQKLLFQGKDKYEVAQAAITTCEPGTEDWFIHARKLDLDYTRNIGEAHHARIEFKGVPILYTPWLDFALNGQRKSGLLLPTFGHTTQGGYELTLPYYFNLAPNYDLTLSPRVIQNRGLQLGMQGRYLQPRYSGIMNWDVLPQDRLAGQDRYAFNWQHTQKLSSSLNFGLNIQKVSDNQYFSDLSDRIAMASQVNLPREGWLQYQDQNWNAFLKVQDYQTLQDPLNPVDPPYSRMPQLIMNTHFQVPGTSLNVDLLSEYVDFRHPSKIGGSRLHLVPSVSLPIIQPYGFIIPKASWNLTEYRLTHEVGRAPLSYSRQLPVASVDMGLFFDRQTTLLNQAWTQTFEPRAFYVYAPYIAQDHLPLFDTAQTDFNFSQLFSENSFVGGDRVNDANHLTLGAVSRFLEKETGKERFRASIAQRYFFSKQKVLLDLSNRDDRASDILASLGVQLNPALRMDTTWQLGQLKRNTSRFNLEMRYNPTPGRVFNVRYRYQENLLRQFDLSAQWPLGGNWYGIARHNHSLLDKTALETLGGLEYQTNCWAFRIVGQRYVTNLQQKNTGLFFQLELKDLARLGSSPLELLKNSIPGYQRLD